ATAIAMPAGTGDSPSVTRRHAGSTTLSCSLCAMFALGSSSRSIHPGRCGRLSSGAEPATFASSVLCLRQRGDEDHENAEHEAIDREGHEGARLEVLREEPDGYVRRASGDQAPDQHLPADVVT